MLTALLVGALGAPAMLQAATDTVIPVQGATRLQVENQGGSVVVEGWDRNEVRVQAEHNARTRVSVRRRGDIISVEAEGMRGPALITDIRITAPRSLAIRVEGMFTDVTVNQPGGDVSVETLEGAIEVIGGQGTVRATTVNGVIRARDTQGRLELQTIARGIEVENAQGEVYAESVSGPIVLKGMRARVVDVGSVSGRVLFEGTLPQGSRYAFGSHSGRVSLILPANASASITVASLSGSVESAFAGQLSTEPRRRRSVFTLGGGDTRVEVETFSGSISLLEAGSEAAVRELERTNVPATPPRPPRAPRPPGDLLHW